MQSGLEFCPWNDNGPEIYLDERWCRQTCSKRSSTTASTDSDSVCVWHRHDASHCHLYWRATLTEPSIKISVLYQLERHGKNLPPVWMLSPRGLNAEKNQSSGLCFPTGEHHEVGSYFSSFSYMVVGTDLHLEVCATHLPQNNRKVERVEE